MQNNYFKNPDFVKVSVALCTYNGEKFLYAQLLSIVHQDRCVQEVVISDDNSTDNTINIIKQFELNYPDIKWIINQNISSKGCCANFDDTIKMCSGDIIFLCDQDDIWETNKVQYILDWFYRNPLKEVVFTNASFINENGSLYVDKLLFDVMGCSHETCELINKGFAFDLFMQHNRATGATMALRHSFINKYSICRDPFTHNYPLHDEIIAITAALYNKLGVIDIPLTKYRIHTNQTMGMVSWINNPSTYSNPFEPYKVNPFFYQLFESKQDRLRFCSRRYRNRNSMLCWKVLFDLNNYVKYYGSSWWRVYFYDIIHGFYHKYISQRSSVLLNSTI